MMDPPTSVAWNMERESLVIAVTDLPLPAKKRAQPRTNDSTSRFGPSVESLIELIAWRFQHPKAPVVASC